MGLAYDFAFCSYIRLFLIFVLGQDLRKKKVFAVKEEDDRLERMINQQEKVLSRKDIEISYPNIRKSKDLIYLHLVSHNALLLLITQLKYLMKEMINLTK